MEVELDDLPSSQLAVPIYRREAILKWGGRDLMSKYINIVSDGTGMSRWAYISNPATRGGPYNHLRRSVTFAGHFARNTNSFVRNLRTILVS